LVAVAIAALILLASVPPSHAAAPINGPHPLGGLPLSPRGSAFRPASMGLSAAPDAVALQNAPSPAYDEQLGTTFTQDFTSLEFNVTVLAQADADGYGPGYLLNGLTPEGYWYQVGISYHWPNSDGSYDPGFGFSYQVYGPSGKSVYPSKGAGLGGFSGVVDSGDSVLLSLNFTGSTVLMLAQDWNTSATAEVSYSSAGAVAFVGDAFAPVDSHGFFSGLMTEWYHSAPYYGNEQKVAYTNEAIALTSAWMWIDEFESGSTTPSLFDSQSPSPVTLADDQVYPFAADGATVYISAHQFVTGASATSTTLTLTPATPASPGEPSPSFSASYTLAGQQQTANIGPGTTVLDADPGTMITVSISESDSIQGFWVFSNGASPNEVTFAAGANATYVYYDLVSETISYQVAGGGQAIPGSSEPELTYQEPPPVASATASAVTAMAAVSTTPTTIAAILGSDASLIGGAIPGAPGERWATSTQNWTFDATNVIPGPLEYYQQYDVSISYSVFGGGTPSQVPEFNSTAFGVPVVIQLSNNSTAGWFDAGSDYSFTNALNGTTSTERWFYGGSPYPTCQFPGLPCGGAINAPNQVVSAGYTHQYYVDLAVNDVNGGAISGSYYSKTAGGGIAGSVSLGAAWMNAGQNLTLRATAQNGWQFENWAGSGTGAYNGTDPTINATVTGPLNESATFYPQLAISADGGTNVVFSYGSESGSVPAGTTKTLYIPPSTNVTLRASPSLFIYSFASWQASGLARVTRPSLALVVNSPSEVTATSSYSYLVVLGAVAVAAIIIILALSLLIRDRRKSESESASTPT
jgi:Divergent InlB B-repeat domain